MPSESPPFATTPCLCLHGVMYVPSYTNPSRYAVPGGGFVTLERLLKAGAIPQDCYLWQRSKSASKTPVSRPRPGRDSAGTTR